MHLMDRAQFEDANKQLRDCLELIPQRQKAKEMLKTCRGRAEKFVAAYNQALIFAKQTLLLEAQKLVKMALSQAAQSPEALAFADELSKTLEKTRQLTSHAYSQLPRAEFDQVCRNIAEIEQMQADNKNVPEIKKQLAKIQNAYVASMENAQAAKKVRELKKALKAVEQALQLCPESLEAQTLLKQTKANQDEAHHLVNDAISAIKAAKFDEADAKLRRIDEVWPGVNGRDKALQELAESRDQYTEKMNVAKKAQAQKDLEAALQASKAAVSICPKSQEALELTKSIDKARSGARNHLRNAKKYLNTADFDKALEQVKKAKDLWAVFKKVEEMEAEISSTSSEFRAEMATAEKRFEHHDFVEARAACDRALYLCPDASEPEYLRSKIEDIEKQKALQRAHAKEIAKSTGKWTGCLIGAAVVLALIVIIAISFWRWVTGTVCPWFVANQGSLIMFCVVLSILQGIIHASRSTNTWIDTGGGIFLGPLVIVGIIVLVSALMAAYAFESSWKDGTAVGLVIGVVVCGLCVIFSFTDS